MNTLRQLFYVNLLLLMSASAGLIDSKAATVREVFAGNCSRPSLRLSLFKLAFSSEDKYLQKEALLGDIGSAKYLSSNYSFGNFDAAKSKYWMLIASQNGDSQSELIYAEALETSGSQYGQDFIGLDENFRAFFWASLAAQTSTDSTVTSSANDFLNGINQNRLNYWTDVEYFYRASPWIIIEAKILEKGPPILITSIDGKHVHIPHPLSHDISKQNPYQKITINSENVEAIDINALLGDTNAAARLTEYYGLRNDNAKRLYWQTIAAEDGDTLSQLTFAKLLAHSVNIDDRTRSLFWAKKALMSANPLIAKESESFINDYPH